ncbi:STAS domain-containing protein [Albibacterium bauzanense]|uniref:Anti-anti-sigma factor n=1 Tax=Albibacterium bauzanense TaxID=653929 RepID=A0A4R1M158_9SPHI|nr:STAS domain-containing protein [Albibacterium bauzanense]TCK85047.1 anti-anti-sigma factor [Albibacterium bauzanense]
MKFTIDRHERYVVLKPHEKVLDGSAAPQVKSEFVRINTDGQRNIVLDLSEVEEIDSSGLRSALMAHRMCKALGGIFILAHANSEISQLIEICKLDEVLLSVPTIQEAEDIVFMEELEKEFRGSSASEEG